MITQKNAHNNPIMQEKVLSNGLILTEIEIIKELSQQIKKSLKDKSTENIFNSLGIEVLK